MVSCEYIIAWRKYAVMINIMLFRSTLTGMNSLLFMVYKRTITQEWKR